MAVARVANTSCCVKSASSLIVRPSLQADPLEAQIQNTRRELGAQGPEYFARLPLRRSGEGNADLASIDVKGNAVAGELFGVFHQPASSRFLASTCAASAASDIL